MTLAFWLAWAAKSTLILSAAFLASLALRGSSAAVRNLLWRAALAGMLLLPLFEKVDWRWRTDLALPAMALDSSGRTVVDVVARAGSWPWSLAETLFGAWTLGAAYFLVRALAAQSTAALLARRSRPWHSGLRLSDDIAIPMVCGLFRPVILLPAQAVSWAEDRLRIVLAHESMHIQRHDTRWQALAQAACAFYWPHPLAWRAAAELRKESEQACDDGVLGTGVLASAYAGHLVDVARGLRTAVPAPEGAIAMARFHELERRVTALLNPQINRHRAGLRATALAAAGALSLLVLISGVRLTAQPGARLAGIVYDASGAVVPGAQVVVTFPVADAKKGVRKEFAATNAAGEFRLEPIPEGAYSISISKPGFARLQLDGVDVKAAQTTPLKFTLNIGRIQETLNVGGAGTPVPRSAPAPSPTSRSDEPKRISVGGNVQQAMMVEQVRPLYPPECKSEGVEGTVLFRAVIGREGQVLNLEPINQLVDPRLVSSATDAVRQWKYKPTLLNGAPVEVVTEIQINYTLAK